MTEADPAFDTVHPSGHILVRSCRGGYMHSVTLSEAAMNTDAESLAQGILLTADVSYLKAVMEVRGEIVAAGYTPSAEVPTAHDLDMAIEKLVAHELQRREATRRHDERGLADPGLDGVSIRERYRWAARPDWRRTTLAPGQAVRVLHSAAVAARNQPHAYATQTRLFPQFTAMS